MARCTVSKAGRIRRQQLLRQAEGYLELILSGDSADALDPQLRDKLATRCLDRLAECEKEVNEKGHLLYLRGEAYRLMERYGDAIEPLSQAIEFDGENVYIYLALAWCHKRVGNLDLAIDALEQGLEIDYALAILHYNLACYWALLNRPKLAVSYLSTAFEIDSAYRDLVAEEADFDLIRQHPDFLAIMTVIV